MGIGAGTAVLVIDDEPVLCECVVAMLSRHGCRVFSTTDSRKWRSACGDVVPEVVILDLFMPERDGLETMREIKAAWPRTRLLAVSGSVPVAAPAALRAASRLGADAALSKPLVEEALVATIARVLGVG